jgi:hypothetical protein
MSLFISDQAAYLIHSKIFHGTTRDSYRFLLRTFVQITKFYFSYIYVLFVRISGYLFTYSFIIHPLLLNKLNKPKQIFQEQANFMRRLEFYSRPGHVRILVDSVVLGEVFLKVLRFLSASVILSTSHSHSLIFNRSYVILANGSVVK